LPSPGTRNTDVFDGDILRIDLLDNQQIPALEAALKWEVQRVLPLLQEVCFLGVTGATGYILEYALDNSFTTEKEQLTLTYEGDRGVALAKVYQEMLAPAAEELEAKHERAMIKHPKRSVKVLANKRRAKARR